MIALRRFLRNERGAVVIDHIPVFFALTIIVLFIIEIGLAQFLHLRAHKAVQLGARTAASLPAAIASVPTRNEPLNESGGQNIPCYSSTGTDNCTIPSSSCTIDGLLACWTCTGSGCSNTDTLNRVVQEMRRVEPSIDVEEVTLTYIYRRLGYAGGEFIPEINVSIPAQSYDFALITLGSETVKQENPQGNLVNFRGTTIRDEATVYFGISASAFGEDMSPTYTATSGSEVSVGTAPDVSDLGG